jgi:hypothetical protein
MARAYITHRRRPGVSFGSLVMGFVYLMVAVLFIALLAVVVGGALLALLIAVIALGVHRLLMLISGRYRARRAVQGPFRPVTKVIDVTASTAKSKKLQRPHSR